MYVITVVAMSQVNNATWMFEIHIGEISSDQITVCYDVSDSSVVKTLDMEISKTILGY